MNDPYTAVKRTTLRARQAEAMERIAARDGCVTREALILDAEPPDSATHADYEWDDKKAGESYRLEQARTYIRMVKVRFEETPDIIREIRAYTPSARTHGDESWSYRPTVEILAREDTADIMMRSLERDWRALKAKYGHMDRFRELISEASVIYV